MFDLSPELQNKLRELNSLLKNRRENLKNRVAIREMLKKRGAKFISLKNYASNENLLITGIDGSVNYYGVYPYRIFFFQAYAATPKGDKIIVSDVKAPFLEDKPDDDPKDRVLPALELEASLKAIDRFKPDVMLFDGGFIRYRRHAPERWEQVEKALLEKDVLGIGIIEEAQSQAIAKILTDRIGIYDREILFGLLNPGEALFFDETLKEGFFTVFARLSRHPQAIAVDFLESQKERAKMALELLYALTPEGSRGIPFFLDVIDSKTKLSKETVEILLASCFDREILELYLRPLREERLL
ncbi:DNA double-strand break repair nuclease NurA [Carboxydothermus pertinax]|uniref:NurA domain-containing protein n=1 Tax=Carboxydothermus pertinax TaxID=870242 RepID=A0A1L8CUD6_9THEO|nr:DNA double-strand break repair nuclease NurA [Carboxydothermus pertinax]GAV22511.1 hypothetical protein cpu_10210 [Carboxydothermus pertinax]